MLSRAAPSIYPPSWISIASGSGVLPFLYCTRTILRTYRSQSNDRPARNKASRPSPSPTSQAGAGEEVGSLLAEWDKKRSAKHDGQRRASSKQRQSQFGKDGFKVNESASIVWQTFKPRRLPSSESRGQKAGDDSYAPFAGWSGPSKDDVDAKPLKRVHRDASQIPFERPKTKARDDPYADLEGTTITPSEKKAFQALFE